MLRSLSLFSEHGVAASRGGGLGPFATPRQRADALVRIIFDRNYYLRQYPDVAAARIDPLTHFMTTGWAEIRNPCALFDTAFYLERYPDVAAAGLNPLLHYVRFGARERRQVSLLFDAEWYLAKSPDVAEKGLNPLAHYLSVGAREGREANPLFDQDWYLKRYPHAAGAAPCALAHFAERGAREKLSPHPAFDTAFYLSRNPDIARAGVNPLAHYLAHGRSEGRQAKGSASAPHDSPAPATRATPLFSDRAAGKSPKQLVQLIRLAASKPLARPLVTVIIPAYQQLAYTLRCVLSTLDSRDRTPFEILIVDDHSPDRSGEFLSTELQDLPRLRVIRNENNLGFLRSCNAVAAKAATEHILFLNNDTAALDGWLDELVATFGRYPDAGLVGSKLVYPDGRLQEAGGIIWEDASGANFGRGDDPQRPEYNYLRDADYISGAAILVARSAWRQVGGFSEEFAPAYYEDTDLAMKIRAIGKRVLYQPLSTVVHYEGATSGTDVTKGIKRHQEINRVTFHRKWRDTLRTHGEPGRFGRGVVDRRPKGRILIFDAEVPTPDKDSGSVTAFNYMRLLTELDYRVTFVPENLLWCGQYSRELQRLGVEVIHGPYYTQSHDYVLKHADSFDLIILSRASVGGKLINELRAAFPQKPIVFDTVDLHHLRIQRQYVLEGRPELLQQARELRALELNAIQKANLTILVSDHELDYLRDEIGPFPHIIIPLIYDHFDCDVGFEDRRDFAFVGGFRHTPNVDAVKYLIEEIWPRFRTLRTGAKLHIIGSHMPAAFGDFSCDDIKVVGFVEDLEAYMRTIRVSLAPLRYGAGVKGKVGNSMRMGVPVIGTPIAVEGMGLINEQHVLLADGSEVWARQMRRLYSDSALWTKLSRQGQRYVQDKFGLHAARAKLETLCSNLLAH